MDSHFRMGHVRFPVVERPSKNPPTNAAIPIMDTRVAELKSYVEALHTAAHGSAMNPRLTPDDRSQNLGAYLVTQNIINKLSALFAHEVIPDVIAVNADVEQPH